MVLTRDWERMEVSQLINLQRYEGHNQQHLNLILA